jgi:hypothetical protein
VAERHFGFTGSQIRPGPRQCAALGGVLGGLGHDGFIWMHNGDCVGSDDFAGRLWKETFGHRIHLHPPIISTKRAFLPCDLDEIPKDYRERNQDIVNASELLVATPKEMHEELRSGTWMTIRMARRRGIPRTIVWPDGSITVEP